MSRRIRAATAAALAAAALGSVAVAAAAPAKVVNGSVGPTATIKLTMDGKKVTKLKAGKAYRFVVNDRSSEHDFHLSGPGVNRQITGLAFTGQKSVTLTLAKGTYTFFCKPHKAFMKGTFTVS
jgi:plastocyanin